MVGPEAVVELVVTVVAVIVDVVVIVDAEGL
jgi:hypothetical protein